MTHETQDPATPGSGLITMSKTPSSNLSHETRKIHFSGRKWLEWWLSLMTFPHHRNLATPLLPISLTRDQEITHLNICTKVIFWNLKDLNCINCIILKFKDLSIYFYEVFGTTSCLTLFSFRSLFFQFYYCLRNQNQLFFN